MHLGESIDAGGLDLTHRAEWLAVLQHHREAVRPLGDQRERFTHRSMRRHGDRGVVDRMGSLHLADNFGDDISRNVLGDDGDPPSARHRFGHASS